MRLRSFPGNTISIILLLGLPWLLSCAGGSQGPEDENHPPVVTGISILGGGERIGAGDQVVLKAGTSDIDGDTVTLTWSGEGILQGTVDQENKTVSWLIPSDGYGDQTVTCIASDGQAVSAPEEETFPVGRVIKIDDYGLIVGGEVNWATGAGQPPFYILQGIVTIEEMLLIDQGVTVYCKENSFLKLRGGFTAQGESGYGEIAFRPLVTGGGWEGIELTSSTEVFDLTRLLIYNAEIGISVYVASEVRLDHCMLNNCDVGLKYDNVSEPSALLQDTGSYFLDCGVDFIASSCELQLTGSIFTDSQGVTGEGITIAGGCSGFFSSVSFNKNGTAITLSGGSYLDFHGNTFTGEGVVFFIGPGYGESPLQVDARCNSWGTNSDAEIRSRIDDDTSGAAGVKYSPWIPPEGGDCQPAYGPEIVSGIEIDGDVIHPLGDNLPTGTDLDVLAIDGIPRLLYIDLTAADVHVNYVYQWELMAGEGSLLEDPGVFSSHGLIAFYPGQSDGPAGSSIYFVAQGGSSVTIKVTVTDPWDLTAVVEEILSY
jgi:hypothetical protein